MKKPTRNTSGSTQDSAQPMATGLVLELQRRGSMRSSHEVGALEIRVCPERDTLEGFRPARAACFRLAALVEEITASTYPHARWHVSVDGEEHRVRAELVTSSVEEISQARGVLEAVVLKSGLPRRINRLANFWWPETLGRYSVTVNADRAPAVGEVVKDSKSGKSWRVDVVNDLTAYWDKTSPPKYEIQGPETAAVPTLHAVAVESFQLSE